MSVKNCQCHDEGAAGPSSLYEGILLTICIGLRPRFCAAMILCVKSIVIAFLITIFSVNSAIAASDMTSEAQTLIEQASAKRNIVDLPGLRLTANVHIDNDGKPLDGTYALLENTPDQWREEIVFPGYSELRVGTNGLVYLKRSTDFEPYRISQLRRAIGMDEQFRPGPYPGDVIKKIREKKISGAKANCVEIATEEAYTYDVCVDEISGMLTRNKEGITEGDFQQIGTKVFPHSILLKQNGKTLVQVAVTELSIGNSFSSALFQSQPGAISNPGCLNAVPSHRIKNVAPVYPEADKLAHKQGTVAVYVVVGTDGRLHRLRAVQGVTPTLNDSALTSIAKWEYEPATCNGNPVETETVLEVHYVLGY